MKDHICYATLLQKASFSQRIKDEFLKELIDSHPTTISNETLEESEDLLAGKEIIVDLNI